jgi:hypothetical protein
MTPAMPSPAEARRMVCARLGREPQDMLEAAVVLEAWAGVPARRALRLGREIVADSPTEPHRSVGKLGAPDTGHGFALDACSFVTAVVAIAGWAGPLTRSLGLQVVAGALTLALPLTLALQWGLASRYLGRPTAFVHLGRRPILLPVVAWLALVAGPAAALGETGALAGLLTLTWTGGAILLRRRWALVYVGIVLLGSGAMFAGLPAPHVVAGSAVLTTIAVAVAVHGHAGDPAGRPGRWGRALVAAAIGAGVGALLIADGSINSDLGMIPAFGLLPSSLASVWGGSHLWRFQHVIPGTLAGVPLLDVPQRGLGAAPVRVLIGTVGRILVLTAVLSALLVAGARALHVEPNDSSILVGYGLLALATLLLSLLESLGRGRWALFALVGGIGAEGVTLAASALPALSGGRLIVGASVVVVLALPIAVATLGRPATTLATSMGIR